MEERKIQYTQKVEYMNGFKVIHNKPILSDEEKRKRQKETLINLYNLFFSGN